MHTILCILIEISENKDGEFYFSNFTIIKTDFEGVYSAVVIILKGTLFLETDIKQEKPVI